MKIQQIIIHNFRSVLDADIEVHDYMLLVGANNAGKSTILNALRVFYDDIKWSTEDFPKTETLDNESWVQLKFKLDDEEWVGLADEYKRGVTSQCLTVRRYFKSDEKGRVQKEQSNIYGFVNGEISKELFYGAKNVGTAKVGQVLYVPALANPTDQTKMSGPSPLRNMLNFLLKKVVSKSEAFKEVTAAFEKLNEEARKENGFLTEISNPLNVAIEAWGIKIDLSVDSVAPEDISKSLVRFAFLDASLGDTGFDLDRYGHGFQRSVIYELIRLAPTFKDEKKTSKKEFNPLYNLVLFEEPEAFLHPSQQESMAYHLRRLSAESGQQVFITTHSPIFAGKAAQQIGQIIRVQRSNGVTKIFQPKGTQINEVFDQGGELLIALQAFVANKTIHDNKKSRARKMIENPPEADIAIQEERFRFQLWLDSERSSLFFADKVLLVEGATERALFNYLLANDWHDLSTQRICIVDALGKFNFHRFMALFKVYGIPHGVMLDDDNNNGKDAAFHGAINDLVGASANLHTLATPVMFPICLENFLGLQTPDRDDKKPLEILKVIASGQVATNSLLALREKFCEALAIA
ncbi:Predicted ATP-dependent endonuclease of the OLD family, contains P-loop ATPase and TOPRIM domains [Methylomagnum ishizawai]|uniref:Predicted ATP-dependent endonuclease of the OLD family, contains P-loop ATPase and TOPRIM domains n=2 Tax=Methylomagnum ishizawai TaxID=1760988 RepID=A0A1Y6D1A5_9GAMM|nr:Predicted ATP-dependent endonuclease of the OLD family, contains P-loop ATPase and TOPRIM domains [Methylomagnum ishizawai]